MKKVIKYGFVYRTDPSFLWKGKYYNKRPSYKWVYGGNKDWVIVTFEIKEIAREQ